MNYKVFIGNILFNKNKKEYLEITPFIENKSIVVQETSNNVLPTIDNITITVYDREDLMQEIDGAYNFFQTYKDFSRFPLYVIDNNNQTLFNGFVEKSTLNHVRGFGFNNTSSRTYELSLIHKMSELNDKYITRILSSQTLEAKKYFNYLFETNNRITRYTSTEFIDITADSTISELVIEKSNILNYKALKLGDALHRKATKNNSSTIEDSYIIKSIKDYKIVQGDYIEYINISGGDLIKDNLIFNIIGSDLTIYRTGEIVGSGVIIDYYSEISPIGQNGISGNVKFNPTIDDIPDLGDIIWGTNQPYIWGGDYTELIWGMTGKVLTINVSELTLTFDRNINLYENTTAISDKIGFKINTLDDSSNPDIKKSIIKFNSALSLINSVADDYSFNYNVDSYGNIDFFTNTANEIGNYNIQIGNTPGNFSDVSNFLYNALIDGDIIWGAGYNITWGTNITGLTWGTNNTNTDMDYYYDTYAGNLDEGNRYGIIIQDTDAEYIKVFDSQGNEVEYYESESYYDATLSYIFTNPIGNTVATIRFFKNIQSPTMYANGISVVNNEYTQSEANAIFYESSIDFDASGIRTAMQVTAFDQEDITETIEQLNYVAPAINTWHKLDDEPENLTQAIETGTGESYYYKLGRGYSYFEVPMTVDKNTFIKKLTFKLYRSTLESYQCIFARFLHETQGYIFDQIIPQSQIIGASALTVEPAFLHKKVDELLYCNLSKKSYEQVEISHTGSQNSFESEHINFYSISDTILVGTNDGIITAYTVENVSGNIVYFSDEINLNGQTVYILSDADNSINGTYIELEATNIFESNDDFLNLDGAIIFNQALVKSISIQNAEVCRYPVANIGSSFDGAPNIMRVSAVVDTSTDTYSLTSLTGSPNSTTYMQANNDIFEARLNYNLVYLQFFNNSTGEWVTFRLDSYDDVSGTITLKESVNLYKYGYNGLVQFRRVYITDTIAFGEKPTDDNIYEAYITSDRFSFGFNRQIEQDALDDIDTGFGRIYNKGNVLLSSYEVIINFPRYIESFDNSSIYGEIEEVYSDTINDSNIYALTTNNFLEQNSAPLITVNMQINPDIMTELHPSKNLYTAKTISLYHDALPNGFGVFSIENKRWELKKSGIKLLNLELEKVVT